MFLLKQLKFAGGQTHDIRELKHENEKKMA